MPQNLRRLSPENVGSLWLSPIFIASKLVMAEYWCSPDAELDGGTESLKIFRPRVRRVTEIMATFAFPAREGRKHSEHKPARKALNQA